MLELDVEAPGAGEDRYRVEVLVDGKLRTLTSHLWIEAAPGTVVTEPDAGGVSANGEPQDGCGCAAAGLSPATRGHGLPWGLLTVLGLLIGLERRFTSWRR